MPTLMKPRRAANVRLTQLRRDLVSAAKPLSDRAQNANLRDVARTSATAVARQVGLDLDRYWSTSQDSSGPIDVIDMFSGCGGMSAGFRAINGLFPAYKNVLAVDIDDVANSTYERNLGLKPTRADVAKLARDDSRLNDLIAGSERRPGHPLVLIGCAPCQGFSSHRNRTGQRDIRNGLFVDFAKIAAKLQPDAIVVENVPELLTERYWPYVERAREILEDAGYTVHVGVHNMAQFGVPQERFRAVILALPRTFRPPAGFLPRSAFRTVRGAIGTLPVVRAGQRCEDDEMHYTAGHQESTLMTIRAVPLDGGNRPAHVGPECLRRGELKQGKAMYEDVYGRLHWDRPAITITAYARNPASGRFVHPEQHRGLSVREAALLQGFPVNYWFSGSLDERFRQIGNAVPPIFSSYLAAYVLGEIAGEKISGSTDPGISQPVGISFSRMIPGLKAASTDSLQLQPRAS
jgi:DNA (cytosine-5)-methyltransferase 1